MVKNICSFCSGPRFLFQHPHGGSQSNSNPWDPVSSFEPHGYWELTLLWYVDICRQNTGAHKIYL